MNNLNEEVTAENVSTIVIKEELYHLKKTLLCIGFLDLFFNLINGIFAQNYSLHYINFVSCLVIVSGLYGINSYNSALSWCYGCYLIIELVVRVYIFIFASMGLLNYILSFFIIFVNCYILKLLNLFTNKLKDISDESLLELKNGWIPIKQIVIVT